MMTVARVVCDYPHAVQRELLCHGFRFAGYGEPTATPLGFWQFVSFILGAPPASAVGHALSEGWTTTDHLLANLTEQQAELIRLDRRYERPGLPAAPKEPEPVGRSQDKPPAAVALAAGGSFDRFESVADFQRKLDEHRVRAKKTSEKTSGLNHAQKQSA